MGAHGQRFALATRGRVSQKAMNIVFTSPGNKTAIWLDAIRAAIPQANVWAWSPETAQRQADFAIVWSPPRELFDTQHQLRAVFAIGAGVDALMLLPNLPRHIPIVRLNDAGMAVQMAEYVCHALIRHTRELDHYETQSQKRIWNPRKAIVRESWPVGVMGLGAIGRRVAEAVRAFDYPVFGWSRSRHTLPGAVTFAGAGELDQFLGHVRVLVCVLPLTPDTDGILDASRLGRLKPPAYLINVGRGQQVVEADLIRLIESGHLGGAALDVFSAEPLGDDHPFWQNPRITITPHISAITLPRESCDQIAQKIQRLQEGGTIDGVVDLHAGY
jgi:glyoxylate/hydroxypyruvate reductase